MRPRLLASAIVIDCALCAPAMGQTGEEAPVRAKPADAARAATTTTPVPAPSAKDSTGVPSSPPPALSSIRPDAGAPVAPAPGVSVAVPPIPGTSAAAASTTSLQPNDEKGGPPKIIPAAQKLEPQLEAATTASESDHAAVVRHYAVGYLGFTNIPFGALADLTLTEPVEGSGRLARAPVVGLRYWATPQWGIDVGVGFSIGGGSQDASSTMGMGVSSSTRDALLPRGAAAHLGAPVAVKARKHYVFEVIPELNLGYAALTIANESRGAESVHSGIHLDAGMRAGAEIHFGFLGIPELSLTGSVGVRLDVNYLKTEDRSSKTAVTDTRAVLRSTLGSEPWDLFTGSVSAFYYL
ncbi:MAG TPA: hypothetical protein VKP30_09950 [Polyangiaceae bacterium]|nr:hypothetical protein [Polyangiaceae bacterium]